jgi:hypothetical protein
MFLQSSTCPGPAWKPLLVTFVRCESSGEQIVIKPGDHFWVRESGC